MNRQSETIDIFEQGLEPCAANHAPLTPLAFIRRAAAVFPDKIAVIHGSRRWTYAEFHERCRRLASALVAAGVEPGDTVAVFAPNVPPTLEAHYGVAMAGAVLNAINIRLDSDTLGFILRHGEAKLLITDHEFEDVVARALWSVEGELPVVVYHDPETEEPGEGTVRLSGTVDYEAFLEGGDPDFAWRPPRDEWQAISLNYTSGTTGNPKGVVYSHRGAWLNALGNLVTFGLDARSVYLWTLPMFHCNGWTYTWAVTAAAGTHVCLRKVDPGRVYALIGEHGVTHLCGAPIVLNLLANAPAGSESTFSHVVEVATGGAAPPSPVIRSLEERGFHVTHLYGLTESYGPATVCVWREDWDALSTDERYARMARQGVNHITADDVMVADPQTLEETPRDGVTIGEVMLRGNTVMKGYLKNSSATAEALGGGWFHTGDLGVRHPDGYIEIKDRSKDIIISGGENISSLEVEEVLYAHPAVLEAAVVARPDETWGETPCAFVTPKQGASLTAEEIVDWCRQRMARFKVPKTVVFEELPKTSTGKIQKHRLRERARELS